MQYGYFSVRNFAFIVGFLSSPVMPAVFTFASSELDVEPDVGGGHGCLFFGAVQLRLLPGSRASSSRRA